MKRGTLRTFSTGSRRWAEAPNLFSSKAGSKDDTYSTIEREIAERPDSRATLSSKPGKGKGDAVRLGFR